MTRAGDGFAALAAMVRGWSGPWPSSVRRLLFPGGGRRAGVRRGIGSAVTLLPLLVCCGLLPPLPALPRRTRWAAGSLIVSLASLALLPPAPAEAQTITLSASAITDSSATLTLAGNRVLWWYRRTVPGPAETCSAAQSGGTTMLNLTSLSANTEYTYKVYSDGGCTTEIASETFTTNPAPPTLANPLSLSDLSYTERRDPPPGNAPWNESFNFGKSSFGTLEGTMSGAITNRCGSEDTRLEYGWYKSTDLTNRLGNAIAIDPTRHKINFNPTEAGEYRALAYCMRGTEETDRVYSSPVNLMRGGAVTLSGDTIGLAASAVTQTSATLTLTNNLATWWWKRTAPTPAGDCSEGGLSLGTRTLSPTGLTPGTTYTYKAYWREFCVAPDEIASVTFNTLPVELTADMITRTGARLNFNRGAAWYYKQTSPEEGNCIARTGTQKTADLTDLSEGENYTFKVYSDSECDTELASVDFTTNTPASGAPEIGGTAEVGQTLTANLGTMADEDGLPSGTFPTGYTFQWARVDGGNTTDISGATSRTYTLVGADQGKVVKVTVSFTDGGGIAESLSAESDTVAADSTPPTVSDTPSATRTSVVITFNETVQATGLPGNAFTVKRKRGGSEAELTPTAATITNDRVTLTLATSDGLRINDAEVSVSYRPPGNANDARRLEDGAGNEVAVFMDTAVTNNTVNTPATGGPEIGGTAEVGQTLTANAGTMADLDGLPAGTFPTDYTFQWARIDGGNATDISGATLRTYTPVAADLGKTVRVTVSFTDGGGSSESLSAESGTVAADSTPPTVSGTPTATRTSVVLTFNETVQATGLPGNAFTVKRIRGGREAILTPTAATIGTDTVTLTLSAADGLRITDTGVKVTYTPPGNANDARRLEDGIGNEVATFMDRLVTNNTVNTPASGAPAIGGAVEVSRTLTANLGTMADLDGLPSGTFPTGYTFQWARVDGGTTTDISGETSRTYTLVAADLGKTVKVTVSFTDGGGSSESLSAESGTVAVASTITVTGSPLAVNEKDSNTYTLVLTSQPSGNVTVTAARRSGGDTDLRVSGSPLTFTDGNWNTAQTLTVSAAEDDDTSNGSATFAHSASSGDSRYDGSNVTISDLVANETDRTPAAPNTSNFGVNNLIYNTINRRRPGGSDAWNESFVFSSGQELTGAIRTLSIDRCASGTSLEVGWYRSTALKTRLGTFTQLGGNDFAIGYSPTVSGVYRALAYCTLGTGANKLYSPAANLMRGGAVTLAVSINVTGSPLTVNEGSSSTYTLVLTAQPSNNVTVTATRKSGGDTDLSVSGSPLTFTGANWNTAQTLTVSAAEDEGDSEDGSATFQHSASSGDSRYDGNSLTISDLVANENDRHPDAPATLIFSYIDYTGRGRVPPPNSAAWNENYDFSSGQRLLGALRGGLGNRCATGTTLEVGWYKTTALETRLGTFSTYNNFNSGDIVYTPTEGGVYQALAYCTRGTGANKVYSPALNLMRGGAVTLAVSINVTGSPLTVNEGSSNTYTLVMTGQPNTEVTVTASRASGGDTDLTISGSPLTFSTSNWNTAQTLTVSAAEDADGSTGSATFTHSASSGDSRYDGSSITISDLVANEAENDTPGVTVTGSPLRVNEGSSNTYTMVLDTQPDNNVTVTAARASGGDTDLSISGSPLTFTNANWNTAQTLTVSAAEDDDGNNGSATFTHSASSGDSNYDGGSLTIGNLVATEAENDANLTVSGITHNSAMLRLVSNSAPWYYKKTAPAPADACSAMQSGTTTVSLTALSGDTTYTYKAYSDSGCTTELSSVTFTTHPAAPTTASNFRVSGVAYNNIGRNLPPGSDAWNESFNFNSGQALTGQIWTTITNRCASGATLEVGWYKSTDLKTKLGSINSLTSSINVIIYIPTAAGEYRALAYCTRGTGANKVYSPALNLMRGGAVTMAVGVNVSSSQLNVNEGSSNTYTMVLNTQPSGSHSVTVTATRKTGGDTDLSLSGSPLTFTTSNWNTAQTLTVSAAEDADTANGSATFTHSASSGDSVYDNVTINDLIANEAENDAAGVTVSGSPLSVNESSSATYTLVLTTQPDNNVTVTATRASGGDTDLTISGSPLTFTTSNWNTAQTLTVSAAEDDDGNDGSATFTHSASSGDSRYDGSNVTISELVANENDPDPTPPNVASVVLDLVGYRTISPRPAGSDPWNASFNFTRNKNLLGQSRAIITDPCAAGTTLEMGWYKSTALTTRLGTYSRIPNNTISATPTTGGVYRALAYCIRGTGANKLYSTAVNLMRGGEVTLNVGINLNITRLFVDEGSSNTYTMALNTEPTHSVTVTAARKTGGDTDLTISGSPLTFTTTNWDTAQTLTVSAAEDTDLINGSATFQHSASSGDSRYDSNSLTISELLAIENAPTIAPPSTVGFGLAYIRYNSNNNRARPIGNAVWNESFNFSSGQSLLVSRPGSR